MTKVPSLIFFLIIDAEIAPDIPESDTIFHQYRIKCGHTIQKLLLSGDPSQQDVSVRLVISEYESWLKILDNLPSQTHLDKTKAMISWQLVRVFPLLLLTI